MHEAQAVHGLGDGRDILSGDRRFRRVGRAKRRDLGDCGIVPAYQIGGIMGGGRGKRGAEGVGQVVVRVARAARRGPGEWSGSWVRCSVSKNDFQC